MGSGGPAAVPRASEERTGSPTILVPTKLDRELVDQRLHAMTAEHMLTHFPKNPWCPVCQRANARRLQKEGYLRTQDPWVRGLWVLRDH